MFDKLLRPALGLALLGVAIPVAAQRTHLSCTLPAIGKKTPDLHFDFTMDEAAGSVSYYWNDRRQLLGAVFTADKVTWDEPFYLGTTIRRSINRVTLEYTDQTIDGRKVTTYKGTCEVVTPSPERKF